MSGDPTRQAREIVLREITALDFRSLAENQIERMRRSGESYEMLARWISESTREAIRIHLSKELKND